MIRFRDHEIREDDTLTRWGVGLTLDESGHILYIRCGVGQAKKLRAALQIHAEGRKIYCNLWQKCTYRIEKSPYDIGPPRRWSPPDGKRKGKATWAQARIRSMLALMFR